MKIEKVLKGILDVYARTKGVGHTRATLAGISAATMPAVSIVGHTLNLAKDLCSKHYPAQPIALEDFALGTKFLGDRSPILFDNAAIIALAQASLNKIKELEEKNEQLSKENNLLSTKIANLEDLLRCDSGIMTDQLEELNMWRKRDKEQAQRYVYAVRKKEKDFTGNVLWVRFTQEYDIELVSDISNAHLFTDKKKAEAFKETWEESYGGSIAKVEVVTLKINEMQELQ